MGACKSWTLGCPAGVFSEPIETMTLIAVVALLLYQPEPTNPALAARIQQMLQVALVTGNDKETAAVEAEAKELFTKHGLPTIEAVGDEAAYEFVLMTCSLDPPEFRARVLSQTREAVSSHEIAADAAAYCEAHVRQEMVKAAAAKFPPTNPALRGQIEQMYQIDQSVRQKDQTDLKKLAQTDLGHTATLKAIFAKYGVPTYRMVGPRAASGFVTMIQHQSPEFRARVLPKLKVNVDAGQADPGSYATVFDRSQSDSGRMQRYGEDFLCDAANPQLHAGPIEDAPNVNRRRAEIGLIRLELYGQFVAAVNPAMCGPAK